MDDEAAYLLEQFTMIAKVINNVFEWMVTCVDGKRQFKESIQETIDIYESHLQSVYQNKLKEMKLKEQKETELMQKEDELSQKHREFLI